MGTSWKKRKRKRKKLLTCAAFSYQDLGLLAGREEHEKQLYISVSGILQVEGEE